MSEDLISREKAYKVLTEYYHHKTEMQHKALREALDMVPSVDIDLSDYSDRLWRKDYEQGKADAEPERKKGKWEVRNILDYAQRPTGRKLGECSVCGYLTDDFRTMIEANKKLTNFCPNCGAEMRGEADG